MLEEIGKCGVRVLSGLDPRTSVAAGWELLDQIR
jgi:hypothetical protein